MLSTVTRSLSPSGIMATDRPVVGIAGLGYMGLATALAFVRRGRVVYGYEALAERRKQLQAGTLPMYEPGLAGLLRSGLRSGRFHLVDNWAELVGPSKVVFVCIQTPARPSGRIDLRPLRRGVNDLGRALRSVSGRRLVIIKSTVVPGTCEHVIRPELARVSGKSPDELGVGSNPEFLAEGTMVRNALVPDRIVLGTSDPRDRVLLRRVYHGFPSPLVFVSPTEAELVKYSSNAALALRVSFANEVARMAERLGSDVDSVMDAVGRDPRVGNRYLSAGPGFGGSCFEKDVRALVVRARELGEDPPVLRAILRSNAEQSARAVALIREALDGRIGGKILALLGLSFKAGTDDVRETRALPILRAVRDAGAVVRVHDPAAASNFVALWQASGRSTDEIEVAETVERALDGADVAVIQAAWPEYARWPVGWSRRMRRAVVVDLRRAIPKRLRTRREFRWIGLGVGRPENLMTALRFGPIAPSSRGPGVALNRNVTELSAR